MRKIYLGIFIVILFLGVGSFSSSYCGNITTHRYTNLKQNKFYLNNLYGKINVLLRRFYQNIVKQKINNSKIYNPQLLKSDKNGKIVVMKLPKIKGQEPDFESEYVPSETEPELTKEEKDFMICEQNIAKLRKAALIYMKRHNFTDGVVPMRKAISEGILDEFPRCPSKVGMYLVYAKGGSLRVECSYHHNKKK